MTRWLTLSVLLTVVLISSCASTMTGRKVNTNNAAFCYCHFLPAQCSIVYEAMHIDYKIQKGSGENEYIVSGQATYTGSSTWTEITNGRFQLLLIADERVFQEVSIPVFSGDISRPSSLSGHTTRKKPPATPSWGSIFRCRVKEGRLFASSAKSLVRPFFPR